MLFETIYKSLLGIFSSKIDQYMGRIYGEQEWFHPRMQDTLHSILLEDDPELSVEYFYVDKYITATAPWWLVGKDIITAFIYYVLLYVEYRKL